MSYGGAVARAVPYVLVFALFLYVVVPDRPTPSKLFMGAPVAVARLAPPGFTAELSVRPAAQASEGAVGAVRVEARSLQLSERKRAQYLEKQQEAVRGMLNRKRSKDKRLLIFMVLQPLTVQRTGRAVWNTWAKDVLPFSDLLIYITNCSVIKEMAKTKYPLDKKMEELVRCIEPAPFMETEFSIWQDVYANYRDRYSWFLRVDERVYINAETLALALTDMSPANLIYLGKPGKGRAEDKDKLNLNDRAYCLKTTYLWSATLLKRVGSELDSCLASIETEFADVEIGRCIHRHANVECVKPAMGALVSLQYDIRFGRAAFKPPSLVWFPEQPLRSHRKALSIYPLSNPQDFYLFHTQQVMGLAPVYPAVVAPSKNDDNDTRLAYERAVSDIQKSCTNNPARQLDVSGLLVEECDPPIAGHPPGSLTHMHIMSSTTRPVEPVLVPELGVTAVRVPVDSKHKVVGGLTRVEVGYLLAMKQLFEEAKAKKLTRLFVIDADVVLHCEFEERLKELFASPRCGAHLFSDYQGGILLLGAQEWTLQSWERIAEETGQHGAGAGAGLDPHGSKCYNAHSETTGTFAAVYHKITYDFVVQWISDNLELEQPEAYDRILPHLADLGFITRVANPALAIQDPTKRSRFNPGKERDHPITSPAARASIHRWDTNKYCYYTEFV